MPPPGFDGALSLARPPLRPKRSASGLAGLRSSRASETLGWQHKPQVRDPSRAQPWSWRSGQGALCRKSLQATRKKYPDFESHRENLLASDSPKEQSFFSERNCDISVLSHQRGSPQTLTNARIITIFTCTARLLCSTLESIKTRVR